MKTINLTQNKSVMVDNEDFEALSVHKWFYSTVGYACRSVVVDGKNSRVYMHRQLMKPEKGMVIDHIDRNKLNNQKNNLRVVTAGHNNLNRDIATNSTGVTGVYYYPASSRRSKKWWAFVALNGKRHSLGYYLTKEEATMARSSAINGIFKTLNQVKEKSNG